MAMNNRENESKESALPDIESLRLPPSYGAAFGVKKILTNVVVCRPQKQRFFRVHPDANMVFNALILEDKEHRDHYMLYPSVAPAIASLIRPTTLRTAIDRHNNVFLIPVPLPGEDGKRNQWHESLSQALKLAESHWIRIAANMSAGGYDVYQAESNLGEPDWPIAKMPELLEVAFRGKIITTIDHPIVQSLLGRA